MKNGKLFLNLIRNQKINNNLRKYIKKQIFPIYYKCKKRLLENVQLNGKNLENLQLDEK